MMAYTANRMISKSTLSVLSARDAIEAPAGELQAHALLAETWGTMQLSGRCSRINSTSPNSNNDCLCRHGSHFLLQRQHNVRATGER